MSVENFTCTSHLHPRPFFFSVEWQVKKSGEIEVKEVKSRFFFSAYRCHAVRTKITSSVKISGNKLIQHLSPSSESERSVGKHREVAVRYQ